MHYDIVALPKDQWKGTTIPLITTSDSYYNPILASVIKDEVESVDKNVCEMLFRLAGQSILPL